MTGAWRRMRRSPPFRLRERRTDQVRVSCFAGRVQSRWKAERSLPDWNRLARIGADRLRETRIVDLQGDVFAGLLAGAGPPRAHLWSLLVAGMDTVVRGVLGVRMIGWNDGQLDVERERAQAS